MPQLIAMIVVIVVAMVYMFQTFGGTGDKIEAVAQKSVIFTEINNIKTGISLANKSKAIENDAGTHPKRSQTLEGLASLGYFDSLINSQILNSLDNDGDTTNDQYNRYKAISFGGSTATGNADLEISLVVPLDADNLTTDRPGIFVKIQERLNGVKDFLEVQMAADLEDIAYVDSNATVDTDRTIFDTNGTFDSQKTGHTDTGTDTDGMFTIYFKDIPAGSIK
ncbi:MAG: hypothetical protein U9Q33_11155 [Campylobacterota bacterium]|nr:hypothetical protein [Campylobacterota bacterium]